MAFPFLQDEIMPAIFFYKLVNTNIKVLCKTLPARKDISRRSRNADELADIGISWQGPFSLRIGLYKLLPLFTTTPAIPLPLLSFTLPEKTKEEVCWAAMPNGIAPTNANNIIYSVFIHHTQTKHLSI